MKLAHLVTMGDLERKGSKEQLVNLVLKEIREQVASRGYLETAVIKDPLGKMAQMASQE